MDNERMQEAIDDIEAVIEKHRGLFSNDTPMPMLTDWCFVVAHEDASNPSLVGTYRINRRFQSSYRSAGLLQQAMDDYRQVVNND